MFSSYMYPFYRSPIFGYPSFGFGGFNGFGGSVSNIYGSAIANQSVVNTGSIIGLTQTATPTVIW
jgi:hypothetical protein